MSATRRMLAAGVVGALVMVGCGDDGDDSTSASIEDSSTSEPQTPATQPETTGAPETSTAGSEPEQADASSDEYCAVIEEVGDDLPTDEQFDQILATAPEEIAENLEAVVAAIRADGEAAFSDPDVVSNFAAIESFEAVNCGTGELAAEIDPDAARVDVTATEYSFDFDAPASGATSFVMVNEGEEVHEMSLARLIGDTTIDEAFAAEDPEAEGLVESVGFAGPVAPGLESVLNVDDLTPGRYVLLCFVPAPDGQAHAEKGMISEFDVE